MADSCCENAYGNETAKPDRRWRRVLWAALIINAAMFLVEMGAGAAADSRALQADALDFLGDAANYAVSLAVVGAAFAWRARAALLKSLFMLGFAAWVIGSAILAFVNGTAPDPATMGAVGAVALAANVGVALLLFRYRAGDANMRSVWICSRNDAIGNVAVMVARLALTGGFQAFRQASSFSKQVESPADSKNEQIQYVRPFSDRRTAHTSAENGLRRS